MTKTTPTADQTALIASIKATLRTRLETIKAMPADWGWVRMLPRCPTFFVRDSKTLGGFEHATVFGNPQRSLPPIRNRAGQTLIWVSTAEAKELAVKSLEDAIDMVDTMFTPEAA